MEESALDPTEELQEKPEAFSLEFIKPFLMSKGFLMSLSNYLKISIQNLLDVLPKF
jgi:membrane protein CcdC involved in cytochrome C biogenesis